MAYELITQDAAHIPEAFLLGRLLKKAADRRLIEELMKQTTGIALSQIEDFGGAINSLEDKKRAEIRTLKLINLGLEAALKNNKGFDEDLGIKILKKGFIHQAYAIGKKYFQENSASAKALIKKSQILVKDLWYCLISAEEFSALKNICDLDQIAGTYAEFQNAIAVAVEISSKLELAEFIPKHGLEQKRYWGSLEKGKYPISDGILDCFFLSLIIAGLIRRSVELEEDRIFVEAQKLNRAALRKAETEKNEKAAADIVKTIMGLSRAKENDSNLRIFTETKDFRLQKIFLEKIITLKVEEIQNFIDLNFFEKEEFAKHKKRIEKFFEDYLEVAALTIRIKTPKNFLPLIYKLSDKSLGKIEKEIKNFYFSTDSPEPSKEEIMKFWDQRVFLESTKLKGERNKIFAQNMLSNISPEKIAGLKGDDMKNATALFYLWGIEDQEKFIKKLNPNILINENDEAGTLMQIMHNISWEFSFGWSPEIEKFRKNFAEPEKDYIDISEKKDWTDTILKKIDFRHIHPSNVAEIWRLASDQIRGLIIEHLDEIKVTLPALKNYYLYGSKDTRLIEAVLMRLKDNLSKTAIKELKWLAADMPEAIKIIEKIGGEIIGN